MAFVERWIEDCSKPDLFTRLTKYCYQTGEAAGYDPDCPCLVHKAMRAETAEARSDAMASSYRSYKAAFAVQEAELKQKSAELAKTAEQVKVLSSVCDKAVSDKDAAVKFAAEAKAAAQAFKQSAQDSDTALAKFSAAFEADSNELTRLREIIKQF